MSKLRSVSGRGNRRGFALSAALGLWALAAPASALPSPQQDQPPPTPPVFKPGSAEHEEQTAKKLVPGAIPEAAQPGAVALWKKAIAATRAGTVDGAPANARPVDSFRLTFDLTWRNGPQSNDIPGAQIAFLSPSYVRTTLESGRQLVRGPEGDFLVDRGRVEPIEGREAAQDRKQIDDTIRLAKNFLSLTNPAKLRLKVLEVVKAPTGLPQSHQVDAAKLDWIRVESPDFHLLRRDESGITPFGLKSTTSMYSAKLGLDKKTGQIRQAEIVHLRTTGEWSQDPLFLNFKKFYEQDGFLIPKHLFVYDVERGSAKRGYEYKKQATSSLYLTKRIKNGISLRPNLKPEDFLPPKTEASGE